MAGDYFLGNRVNSSGRGVPSSPSTQPTAVFGRVVDIVLDNSKILYDNQGRKLPIGAIIYQDINTPSTTEGTLPSALPITVGIKQYPLINEIVVIQVGPSPDFQESPGQVLNYYTNILNIWGSPNHNALPTQGVDFSNPVGENIPELKDINPLYPSPGDILIEGRQGQSVRIGGYSSKENPITNSADQGQPYIVISNGQVTTTNGLDYIVEDINKDFNSLYFLSNHKSSLEAANTKRNSYNTIPQASNEYKGNQVIINGGRLYFNAKEESILLSAKESIGLNANTVNIDATDYFCVDAKKIYIGERARTATSSVQQPVILGKQLENWLGALLDALDSVATAMQTASAVGAGPVTQLNAAGPVLKATISSLKSQYKIFQSKKVFTE